MISNFEEITSDLNEREQRLVPFLIAGFKARSINNPIKAPEIVRALNENPQVRKMGMKVTEVRLRKCVHYIRANGLLPLIATSRGYYTSDDRSEIIAQIVSLEERARSIQSCADGMRKLL